MYIVHICRLGCNEKKVRNGKIEKNQVSSHFFSCAVITQHVRDSSRKKMCVSKEKKRVNVHYKYILEYP